MSVEQISKANKDLNRAELSRQIMENPIFIEAMIAIKGQLVEKFQTTTFKERDERDEVWRKMQTVSYIESYLQEVMETGELAIETLSMLDKLKKSIR